MRPAFSALLRKALPLNVEYVVIPTQSLSSALPLVVEIGSGPLGASIKFSVLSTIS